MYGNTKIHGGGGQPHEVPDWKIYSNKIESIPVLKKHQERLALLGLKDPWIRNEVWKYMPEPTGTAGLTPYRILTKFVFKGLGSASAAMVLTIAYDKLKNGNKKG